MVIDPARQRKDLREGESVWPNPNTPSTTLAYAIPYQGFKSMNTISLQGPTGPAEFHEQAHIDNPDWSEEKIRNYTFNVFNDHSQLLGFVNYTHSLKYRN